MHLCQQFAHRAETGNMIVVSRQQHRSGWGAAHRNVEVSELYAAFGKCIDVWCLDLAAKTTQIGPAHVVGHDQQDIGLFSRNNRCGK